jgi:error-prone DNA polymerase
VYAELHAKTNFSFLEGASHPDELVSRAAELGYRALAVTDRNSLAGVVRAHGAAKDAGLKLIIGAEITPEDAPPVVLWAPDRAAYGRLARLITQGRRRAEKGRCRLSFADIAEHSTGLLAGIKLQLEKFPEPFDAMRVPICNLQFAISDLQSRPPLPSPLSSLPSYRELFADRCYLLAELHYGPDDCRHLDWLREASKRTGIPLVAAGEVHYHVAGRAALHDVLTAIRHGRSVAEVTGQLFPNAERHLKSPEEMAALFADAPDALRRTLEIADRCTFSLDELRYEYPEELAPPGITPGEHLARLTWTGARRRWPHGVPDKVRSLVEHELQLIAELHYEAYFLTVWDLVRFARRRGILCQGRGSAANSVVCYCLGITSVDPERMDVLFERFVSRERNEAPDIDVDFEHQRREEVIQYLYRKYGRERAGMTAEVITYRPRSAVRDVGKALGMLPEQIDQLAKRIEHSHGEDFREDWKSQIEGSGVGVQGSGFRVQGSGFGGQGSGVGGQESGFRVQSSECESDIHPSSFILHHLPPNPSSYSLAALVDQLIGFPRHLSQHTGGMVMTRGPLCELVPIENAAMPDRTVIQWNKDDLGELGILKVDCLALGMLTAIRRCFQLVRRHHRRRLTLANIPEGDKGVYAMIRRADTMGVFQIESRAQMSMLPRLGPRSFYDLVIEVAIIRPGPIQGGMVHPYLRRRNGEEPVSFPNELVRGVLEKTLGVPLFQEQAMRLAVVAAGFTPGEADQLRRAMGAWRRPGIIDQFRLKLIDGMRARGFSQEYAEAVFRQIRGFGDYGFPESHAASFALLVYASAWLKHHFPAAFAAALLNSQPMGFYAPAQLVRDAREHGVTVLPVDVNFSQWECTLEAEGERGEGRGVGDAVRSSEGNRKMQNAKCKMQNDEPASSMSNLKLQICNLQCPSTLPSPLSSLPFSLRLGFNMLLGMSSVHGVRIEEARREGPFGSVEDFARRTGLGRAAISRLARAGAMGSLASDRRAALWDALAQDGMELPLFDGKEDRKVKIGEQAEPRDNLKFETCDLKSPLLPPMSAAEEVLADYRAAGLSLRAHPMQFLRQRLSQHGVGTAKSLAELPNGRPVRVAGIVLVRQRPGTAKGITFVTLEDETGTANLIIRPAVWKRFREAAHGATLMLAEGRLQREGQIIHVLAAKLEDLSPWLRELGAQSRDFC